MCLTNQLKDLRTIDSNRIALGQVPLYLVAQYTYGTSSDLKAFDGGPLSFALPVTGKRNSLITLAASADSLRFVVNASPGKISSKLMMIQEEPVSPSLGSLILTATENLATLAMYYICYVISYSFCLACTSFGL